MRNLIFLALHLTACLFLFSGLMGCSFQSERVDLIVHNGVVLTLDPSNTIAQAVQWTAVES